MPATAVRAAEFVAGFQLELGHPGTMPAPCDRGGQTLKYRVVQPYGQRREEWTLVSEHATVDQAFAKIEALSTQMVRTGAPSDAVELIVVDEAGNRMTRP